MTQRAFFSCSGSKEPMPALHRALAEAPGNPLANVHALRRAGPAHGDSIAAERR